MCTYIYRTMFKSLCEAGHQPLKRVIIFMNFSGQPKWLQYQSLVSCGLPSAGEHNLLGKAAPLGGRQLRGEGDSYLLLAAAGKRVQQPGKGDPREHQQYLPQYLLHWPKLVQLLNSGWSQEANPNLLKLLSLQRHGFTYLFYYLKL